MFSSVNGLCTLSLIFAEVSDWSEGNRDAVRLGQKKGMGEGFGQVVGQQKGRGEEGRGM